MERLSVKNRLVLAFLFVLVVIFVTAYMQIILAFNTYFAFAICLIASCLFASMIVGKA